MHFLPSAVLWVLMLGVQGLSGFRVRVEVSSKAQREEGEVTMLRRAPLPSFESKGPQNGGLGFRVLGFQGFRVSGFYSRVLGFQGFRVSGFRTQIVGISGGASSMRWPLAMSFLQRRMQH